MFLDLPDPDPSLFAYGSDPDLDPDPFINKQKTDVDIPSKSNKQKNIDKKHLLFLASCQSLTKKAVSESGSAS